MVGYTEEFVPVLDYRTRDIALLTRWSRDTRDQFGPKSIGDSDLSAIVTNFSFFLDGYLLYALNSNDETNFEPQSDFALNMDIIPGFFEKPGASAGYLVHFPENTLIMEILNSSVDRIRSEVKDCIDKSPVIQQTFEIVRQAKKAALNTALTQPRLRERMATPHEAESVATQTFQTLTGSTNREYGRPIHPQNNLGYTMAYSQANRRAQSASVMEVDDENNKDLDECLKEAREFLSNELRELFIEMLEAGEKFQFSYVYALGSRPTYNLSKEDIKRLSFSLDETGFCDISVRLDGANIEFMFKGDEYPFTFDLLQDYFDKSPALNKLALEDPKRYLELAIRLKVLDDSYSFLERLKIYWDAKTSLEGYVNNSDWENQFNPEFSFIPQMYEITTSNIRRWIRYDLLLHPGGGLHKALGRLYTELQKPKTVIEKPVESESKSSGNLEDPNEEFLDNLFQRLDDLQLIPETVLPNGDSSDKYATKEGYEDAKLVVHYCAFGDPAVLGRISELSTLPQSEELENLCEPYVKSARRGSQEHVRISSASYVVPDSFLKDQTCIRISTPPFAQLETLELEDRDGRVVPSEGYTVLWNRYAGNYVVVFKSGNNISNGYKYNAKMSLPEEIPSQSIVVRKDEIDFVQIKNYLNEIGWAKGEEVIDKLIEYSGEKVDLQELIKALSEVSLYGFSSNVDEIEIDNEGNAVLQCRPARKIARKIFSHIKGMKTSALDIARKITSSSLTDKSVALFGQNHTAFIGVVDLSLPRPQVGVFDMTPSRVNNEAVSDIGNKVDNYVGDIVASSIDPTVPLPTVHLNASNLERVITGNVDTELKNLKKEVYGIAKKDLKMSEEDFEKYIDKPNHVNINRDSAPFSRMVGVLEIYHQYIQDGSKDKPVLENLERIVKGILFDEEVYNAYLSARDPRIKSRIKQYFGKYISSSPVVFSVARRLAGLLT